MTVAEEGGQQGRWRVMIVIRVVVKKKNNKRAFMSF